MRNFLLSLFFCSIFFAVIAQSPTSFSYQAIIRNANNTLLTNQALGVRVSILQNSVSGTEIYAETFSVTSNSNGLYTLEIGQGVVENGVFNAIDWANGPYFIKTETDPEGGVNYTITGTSQLLSVPYALHAKTAETLSVPVLEKDPEFNASPSSGITNGDITNWNKKLDVEADGNPTNEIQDLRLNNHQLQITNNGEASIISLLPYLDNVQLKGSHGTAVQNIAYTNQVFTQITGMVDSISVDKSTDQFLIIGSARVYGGSLNGSSSSVGGYFLVLQRSTKPNFSDATVLTYMAGSCYIETPNGSISSVLRFGDGTTVQYIDKNLSPGKYYYRLVFVPNSIGIDSGTFDIYQRDISILEIR